MKVKLLYFLRDQKNISESGVAFRLPDFMEKKKTFYFLKRVYNAVVVTMIQFVHKNHEVKNDKWKTFLINE